MSIIRKTLPTGRFSLTTIQMYLLITQRCSILTPPKFAQTNTTYDVNVLSLQLKAKANYGDLTKYSYYLVNEKLFQEVSPVWKWFESRMCSYNAVSRDNPMPRATGA